MAHLIEYFKKHVAERPNDIFCIASDKRITFAEADRLSDTLDPQYVTRCGDKVAAFIVPRNELMVLVPLAIAKAGLTAMPLDGSYPEERLRYMREDAAKYDGDEAFVLLYTSLRKASTPPTPVTASMRSRWTCGAASKQVRPSAS